MTIGELKQYCIERMKYHKEVAKGAKAAEDFPIEMSHEGSVTAYHEVYKKLCIYFRDNDQSGNQNKSE